MSYRRDIPHDLEREAERAEAVARSLGPDQWPERMDLADMAARLRDMATELRRQDAEPQEAKELNRNETGAAA